MTHLTRFNYHGEVRLGVVREGFLVDVTRAYRSLLLSRGEHSADALAQAVLPPDTLEFFRGGAKTLSALEAALGHANTLEQTEALRDGILVPRDRARVLVPIPNPPKIICVARNYRKHAEEAGLPVSEIPILFPRFAATQIADGDPIIVPTVSEQLDWEGELAFVIGKPGRHIPQEQAFDHVAGYTIFNDVTVRDYQFRVTQYTAGKNFHASGPIGPHITLNDGSLDPHRLQIRTVINGVVKQDANTEEFIYDIPTIIEHISEFIELEAGDIIATGTPAGVGFKRSPAEFLRDGDRIEVTVEGIGTLSNPVRNEEVSGE